MAPVIHRIPIVKSTQETAREFLADGRARVGHVIVADEQTAGRGRYDREWVSPVGGLYATYIVANLPLLSLHAGLAVLRALGKRNLGVGLKWPNDVLFEGRKLAGILIDLSVDRALVGIGVNLSGIPVEGATSVLAAGRAVRRGDLVVDIWEELHRPAPAAEILTAYRAVSATIGRRVRMDEASGLSIEGIARDIDERGRLLVETADGIRRISSAECVHLSLMGA